MFKVIYDHSDFIIIDKSPEVSFHSENEAGLLVSLEQFLDIKLFSVHRLDKGTSGLIVFAKNKEAAKNFSQLWQTKKIQKFYLALSDISPKKKQGTIKGDMEKSRRGSFKLTRNLKNPAITQFVTISIRPGLRLYLCKPITGKTHQIRVAMKSNGSPILGDKRYGGSESDRMYLHAYSLTFEYLGEFFNFKCDPSLGDEFNKDDFKKAIIHFSSPNDIIWPKY